MTEKKAEEIVHGYRKIEEIRDYLKVASDQATPLGRLKTLLGNIGHHVPQEDLQRTYDYFSSTLRHLVEELELELKSI